MEEEGGGMGKGLILSVYEGGFEMIDSITLHKGFGIVCIHNSCSREV